MRHLRTLVVTDAGMDVVRMARHFDHRIPVVIQLTFQHHHPVTEITGEAQLRQALQDGKRCPRIEQRAAAMRLEAASDIHARGDLLCFAKKAHALLQRPGIAAADDGHQLRF